MNMYFKMVWLFLSLSIYAVCCKQENKCQQLLDDLDKRQQQVVACIVARPFGGSNFCLACNPYFQRVEEAYDAFRGNSEHCWAVYGFFKQRINSLRHFSYILAAFWDHSNCDYCIRLWHEYEKKFFNFKACHMNTVLPMCWSCRDEYDDLMRRYKQIVSRDPKNVCFNWPLHMNKTFFEWHELHKCDDNDFFTVLLLTGRTIIRFLCTLYRRLRLG